jgi:hypothetical protein
MSDREDVHVAIVSGGRVGITSGLKYVYEDIEILSPTRISSTPR